MKRKDKWMRFALYPLESGLRRFLLNFPALPTSWRRFGWWNVRCVCMDENAYFLDCITVAKFRSKVACLDFIQTQEMTEYESLFERGEEIPKEIIRSEPASDPCFIRAVEVARGPELGETENNRESKT